MHKIAVNETELAQRWGLSPKTLQRWRSGGRGPRYLKLSKRVTYPLDEILDFERRALHESTVSFRQSCKSAAALECGTAPGAGDTPWGCSSDEGKRREPPAGRRRAQGTAAGLVCRWQSADHRIDARHDQFTASPDSATASAWV